MFSFLKRIRSVMRLNFLFIFYFTSCSRLYSEVAASILSCCWHVFWSFIFSTLRFCSRKTFCKHWNHLYFNVKHLNKTLRKETKQSSFSLLHLRRFIMKYFCLIDFPVILFTCKSIDTLNTYAVYSTIECCSM